MSCGMGGMGFALMNENLANASSFIEFNPSIVGAFQTFAFLAIWYVPMLTGGDYPYFIPRLIVFVCKYAHDIKLR